MSYIFHFIRYEIDGVYQIECGGELTNKGSLSSKNYPKNYDANQDCEWLLSVPEDHTMTIVIKDIDLFASENCSHTVLKVIQGNHDVQKWISNLNLNYPLLLLILDLRWF